MTAASGSGEDRPAKSLAYTVPYQLERTQMASNPGKIVKALFTFQQVFSAAKKRLREQTFWAEVDGVKLALDGRGNCLALVLPGMPPDAPLVSAILEAHKQATAKKEEAAEAVLKNINLPELPWISKLLKE
jgi:DNA-binding protein YbaB